MSAHENHEEFVAACQGCRDEMDESYRAAMPGCRAERIYQKAIALAREDLDMGLDVDERELTAAIQRRLKR